MFDMTRKLSAKLRSHNAPRSLKKPFSIIEYHVTLDITTRRSLALVIVKWIYIQNNLFGCCLIEKLDYYLGAKRARHFIIHISWLLPPSFLLSVRSYRSQLAFH